MTVNAIPDTSRWPVTEATSQLSAAVTSANHIPVLQREKSGNEHAMMQTGKTNQASVRGTVN